MSRPRDTESAAPPHLVGLLAYLDEIGYQDLYLPGAPPLAAPEVASSDSATPPAPPAAPGPRPAADGPKPTGGDRTLRILASEAEACTRCRLAEKRNRVVFGVGDPAADLMLIGEGPGAEEDRRGEPFVGPAGGLLNRILAAIGLDRQQVYIANIVKCRPPGNRDPQADEVEACRSYLDAQIDQVQPRVIVALGRVAAQTLLGTGQSLGRLRGDWHRVRGVDTRVTYHPAGLLRNSAWKRPCWEDMQIVRDRLAEP